ncbi:PepSY domain-containing protein [Streptomyces sp. ME02-8801-2C]|uniref:PepSY domain-containing protein n=1 Tax=Streptomyces sp. ME02-8801-2C TaxID=3028680 RepID=UPI0029B70C44|nr:PepSY domain-containing protein [Streptomyces sp. ME02-8801-2C]MDX3457191.1 PepSY domain-containing protein [Streptomyces sp. ME02-8801-2C]
MKRNIVIATLTAAALAGGTVVAFAAGDDESQARPRTGTTVQVVSDRDDDTGDDSDDRTVVRGGDSVSAGEAIAAALRHTPGTAVSAELDDDGAEAGVWGVDVVRGDGAEYEVKVSGSGKVLGAQRDTEADEDADDRAESAALKGAKVDAREAVRAAAAKGTVVEVGAEEDAGAVAWGAETVKDGKVSEWKVALDTGKVTRANSDDD